MLSVSTDALLAIAQIIGALALLVGASAGLIWMCRRDPKREGVATIAVVNALRAIFKRDLKIRSAVNARTGRTLTIESSHAD